MPKISELVASGASSPVHYGIEADIDDVTPPEGLKEAGIVARLEGGDIPDGVLDAAISWTLAGVDVTLEIPADAAAADSKRILATASAVNVSLSLLPPEDASDEAFEAYCARVEEFALAYVAQANMGKFVVPVTSYLGYMFIEAFSKSAAENFVPTDGYVVEAFHSKVSVERADALKARIRKVFTDAHGGEDGFARFARSLGATIYRRVEESCADEARRMSDTAGHHAAPEEAGQVPAS